MCISFVGVRLLQNIYIALGVKRQNENIYTSTHEESSVGLGALTM